MRNIFLLLFVAACIMSCNNNASTREVKEDTILADDDDEEFMDPEQKQLWVADYDTAKAEFVLRQQRHVDPALLVPEKLVADINEVNENVKLVFRKVSNDTIYVAIPQSEYLTSRMGSSGAAAYMAATTYILTEVKDIHFVNYSFEGGDHLSPGTYTRDSFKNFH